jgi:phage shock protein E
MSKALLLFGLLIVAVVGYLYYYAISSPYKIAPAAARALIQDNKVDVILDVRTTFERDTLGYYPGSIHIPSADLAAQLPTRIPDKNTTIIAYCNTGQRSRAATDILHSLGYANARYITTTYRDLY